MRTGGTWHAVLFSHAHTHSLSHTQRLYSGSKKELASVYVVTLTGYPVACKSLPDLEDQKRWSNWNIHWPFGRCIWATNPDTVGHLTLDDVWIHLFKLNLGTRSRELCAIEPTIHSWLDCVIAVMQILRCKPAWWSTEMQYVILCGRGKTNPPTPLWRWRRAYWEETATLIVFLHKLMGSSAQICSGVCWCRRRVREDLGAKPGQVQRGFK